MSVTVCDARPMRCGRRQYALHPGREQRRRRPLASDIPHDEPKHTVGKIETVKKVASSRRRCRDEVDGM